MKTNIMLCYALMNLFWSCSTLGQGYFELSNRNIPLGVDAPVFDAEGVPLAGTNFLAELYGGITPDRLNPGIDELQRPVIVPFRTQGYFVTGNASFISGVVGGSFAWLQIRAWDSRLGTAYEQVVARGLGGYGESALFYAQAGQAGHLDPPKPLIGLKSFRLRPLTPAVLMRSIRRDQDKVVIDLNPGFKRYQLQQTTALGQPWQNVGEPTPATTITNSISGSTQFFRVIALLE